MKGPTIRLTRKQASLLLEQFRETARHRNWHLAAVAVMPNHVHWVVGVEGDPEPNKVLGDLKAYGSRALNRQREKPDGGRCWTQSGSVRKLPDAKAVEAAIQYIQLQQHSLVIWTNGE